jgi:hypothetical protein
LSGDLRGCEVAAAGGAEEDCSGPSRATLDMHMRAVVRRTRIYPEITTAVPRR